jgi:hypothetical protein
VAGHVHLDAHQQQHLRQRRRTPRSRRLSQVHRRGRR